MAVLAVPQQAARAADLQIAHRNAEAGTERREFPDGRQALGGDFGQHAVAAEGEVGVRLAGRTPDAAADLVQLGKAHAVGIFNDKGVAVAHVDAGLDQRGAHKHVDLVVQQLLPDRGDLFFGHLAVGDADARAGHQLVQTGRALFDAVDTVVQVIDLAAARELLADGFGHDALVVFKHIGLDGLALDGRLFDRGHIPDAGQRHVERARDRRGRKREHIDADEVFLEFLFMLDAEALFLVDDDKAEVAELDVVGQQAVGADDDIDRAVAQAAQRLFLLFGAAVAGQQADADGERFHAGQRRVEVLPGQDRGGGQDRALLAAHHALERRAQGDFGLADADVAAQQAVHRPGLFHIVLDLGGGGQLVGGLLIGKALLKIALPGIVRREGRALGLFAAGVQLDELPGHRLGGGAHAPAGLVPLAAAQAAEFDLVGVAGGRIAGQQVQLRDRDVEHVLFVILDAQVVLGDALHLHAADARIAADAVVLVYDKVAGRDLGQAVQGVLAALLFAARGGAFAKGARRDQRIARKRQPAPGRKAAGQHLHKPRLRRGGRVGGDSQPPGAQVARKACGRARRAGQHRDRRAFGAQRLQIVQQGGHLAAPGGQAVAGHVDKGLERLVGQAAGEVFGQQRAAAPGLRPQPAGRGVQVVQPGAQRAVRHQGGQLLAAAVGGRAVGFADGGRFFQEQQRVFKMVQQRRAHGVAHGEVFVHRRRQRPGVKQVKVGGHDVLHGRAALAALLFEEGAQRFGRGFRCAEQDLARGADIDFFDGVVPALGGQVEGVHRVDLVAPEFNAHGGFHVGGIEVEDLAADGKLAGAVDAVAPHIARAEQQGGEVFALDGVAGAQRAGVGAEILGRDRVLGQALAGHADGLQPPARQVAEHGQAAVFILAPGALDGAQQIVPRREHGRRHAQRVEVGRKTGGFGLAGGDNAERAPERARERRIHKRPPRGRQPEQRARALAGQRPRELFVFFGLQKKLFKHK